MKVAAFSTFLLFTLMVIMTFALLVQSSPTYGDVPDDPYPDDPPDRKPKGVKKPHSSHRGRHATNRNRLVGR